MKALVLTVQGPPQLIEMEPMHTYDFIKHHIAGWLEVVRLPDGTMYVNEEGKMIGLLPNETATRLALVDRSIMPTDYIAGTAVFLGKPDEEGDDTEVDPVLVEAVNSIYQIIQKEQQ